MIIKNSNCKVCICNGIVAPEEYYVLKAEILGGKKEDMIVIFYF